MTAFTTRVPWRGGKAWEVAQGAASLVAHINVAETVVVSLAGELDIGGSAALGALVDTVWQAGWTRVQVDLRGVDFIDSSGLRALLDFSRELAQIGCVMDTRAPEGGMVRLLIDLTSTQQLLRLDR